ncbi:hypothetical protein BGX26_008531 [Mortierella sp. AD094]|nr:hypothetical protein BGX26_008531 [Mortierella sp. AD094]
MNLPPIGKALSKQDVKLLAYQRPPQQWDARTRAIMLKRYRQNPYQRQQIEQLIRDAQQEQQGSDTNEMMWEEIKDGHDVSVFSEVDQTGVDYESMDPDEQELNKLLDYYQMGGKKMQTSMNTALTGLPRGARWRKSASDDTSPEVRTTNRIFSAEYERHERQQRREKMMSAAAEYASRIKLARNKMGKTSGKKEKFVGGKKTEGTKERAKDRNSHDSGYKERSNKRESKGSDSEEDAEMLEPPISVDSEEELRLVLQRLQEEGVRAEVVRGPLTETIEPTGLANRQQASLGDRDGESYADHDDGIYYDEDSFIEDERYAEEDEEPISVKNKEELASVLDRLASEGIRAEVVHGAATRYVVPPTTSFTY